MPTGDSPAAGALVAKGSLLSNNIIRNIVKYIKAYNIIKYKES